VYGSSPLCLLSTLPDCSSQYSERAGGSSFTPSNLTDMWSGNSTGVAGHKSNTAAWQETWTVTKLLNDVEADLGALHERQPQKAKTAQGQRAKGKRVPIRFTKDEVRAVAKSRKEERPNPSRSGIRRTVLPPKAEIGRSD